jgi:FHA domain
VEKGEPYHSGEALPLVKDKVLLGRAFQEHQPDFSFRSPYISRGHATIEYRDGAYFLTDLPDSRHGTWLNGEQLAPGVAREIGDRDRIGLARDEVVLTFVIAVRIGSETWDYPESQPEAPAAPKPGVPVVLDHERREVTLDGRPLALSGRLYDLLCLLYEHRGRAVSDRDIKAAVWQERGLGSDGMPLVTDEELTTVVYRLRKRLEPHGDLVRTVPGYGYMLDLAR